MLLNQVLINISIITLIATFVVGIAKLKSGGGLFVKILLCYIVFLLFIEIGGHILGLLNINNLWLSHVYIPVEYLFLSSLYCITFLRKSVRIAVVASMALFVAFCVVDAVYLESIARLNSYPRSVGSALLILLALLYFYKVFNDMDKLFLEHDPMFLLSAGIVIYYAGTATVFSFLNEVMAHSYEDARMLVNITILLTISFNLLLMVVMRKAPAK